MATSNHVHETLVDMAPGATGTRPETNAAAGLVETCFGWFSA
jgi:hypothetical protein